MCAEEGLWSRDVRRQAALQEEISPKDKALEINGDSDEIINELNLIPSDSLEVDELFREREELIAAEGEIIEA